MESCHRNTHTILQGLECNDCTKCVGISRAEAKGKYLTAKSIKQGSGVPKILWHRKWQEANYTSAYGLSSIIQGTNKVPQCYLMGHRRLYFSVACMQNKQTKPHKRKQEHGMEGGTVSPRIGRAPCSCGSLHMFIERSDKRLAHACPTISYSHLKVVR